jgi:hypothetical protein
MANRWLPNSEDFFENLETILIRARRQLASCDIDSSRYWVTKLENYEEIISLLQARIYQAYPERQALHELVRNLLQLISWLKIQFGVAALRVSDQEQQLQHNCIGAGNGLVQHTGEAGRPRLRNTLNEQQLRYLRDNLGLRWVDIARCLRVSVRTLRRWRYQFALFTTGNHSNLSDQDLDDRVRAVLQHTPCVGLSLVRGALRAQGLNVQRERIRQSMNRIDPVSWTIHHTQFIIRRTYNVRSPNSLWYVNIFFPLLYPQSPPPPRDTAWHLLGRPFPGVVNVLTD